MVDWAGVCGPSGDEETDDMGFTPEQRCAEHDAEESDYTKYRGKCKQLSEAACAADPTLTLVRGHYFCPIWNTEEQHWWCVAQDGTIHDPSKDQFPSKGHGVYTPFDGTVECAECGKRMLEAEARFHGRYAFCSTRCAMRFVGL